MNCAPELCLVSSCLIGLCTRYDGCSKPNAACLQMLQDYTFIPVCPEQLGGLGTPRPAAELTGGNGHDVLAQKASVITLTGLDVSQQFIAGAEAVLHIASTQNICLALLKAKSPSCGITPVPGVTAALLQQNHIRIIEY